MKHPPDAARKNELFTEDEDEEEEGEHFRFCTPQSNGASRKKKTGGSHGYRLMVKISKQTEDPDRSIFLDFFSFQMLPN